MAELLRKCVKEPYRTQLQNKGVLHLKEAVYKQGSVVSRGSEPASHPPPAPS
ncbi:hypothetical protein Esti_001792 [Eimeria stiedai]